YVNLVQAGEVGGILDTILQRLAVYNEKAIKLRRQLRGAMVYPSAVLIIFAGVLGILLGWVIPPFKNHFKDLGSSDELPWLTQIVITVSETFVGYLPFFLLAFVAGGIAISYFYKTPRGKKLFHTAFLKAPVMGPVLRKIAVARFTRTLGTL